jgi:hypothetical protein
VNLLRKNSKRRGAENAEKRGVGLKDLKFAERLDCGVSSPLLERHYVNSRGKVALKPPQSKRFSWKYLSRRFEGDWFAMSSPRNSAFSAPLHLSFSSP